MSQIGIWSSTTCLENAHHLINQSYTKLSLITTWTRACIFANFLGSFHTSPEKLENTALLLRLGLLPTLDRHKTELFKNALQTGGIWKRQLFVFVWTEKILKTELFDSDCVTIIRWFLWVSFPQTQIQNQDNSTHSSSHKAHRQSCEPIKTLLYQVHKEVMCTCGKSAGKRAGASHDCFNGFLIGQ